ncbi:phospholipase A-2-activating protein [Sporothrix schenckii 1099-18]|uniref:Phospholipase A-2-activating protein n=1 Tax=Sporothrix schenckii 1099-18 TaxID=1397361 RepID=A0A0F2MES1_SPOSC|nr:phospholipase A-2-activating protein [Sporothrix schenckii 1099-18]KJR86656.1 phospholipase A-2-activating protein [Sporothrix schenckii 1099-18]
MASNNNFQLSASLTGHEKDVRAVCFPVPGSIYTASRDCTVQAWNEASALPPTYSGNLLAQGPYSFNSLAFLPPSENRPQYPKGLVLAGSHGHTIEVCQPNADISGARVALLSGHTSNVSALSVSPNGDFAISGDWDGRAKLWNTNTWEADLELIGPDPNDKQRAIWAVLAYSNAIIMTGSADHVIRGYSLQTKREKEGELQPGVFIRTPDVVRALCRVRKHPSNAQVASAGNDFLIRLWQFNGAQVGVLRGHESFIYALDSLPTGELVSSSEDRTVRIWKDQSCIQTITHPALSIWSVSVCQKTGDFATGASDNIARIFTRDQQRTASENTLREFSESLQRSSIPQQQMDDINPNTLPGPEFIETKSGTKEGQTVMINSGNGNISVYQWSVGQNQWLLVGSVVDSSSHEVETETTTAIDSVTDGDSHAGHALGPYAVFVTLAQSNFTPVLNRIKTVNSTLSEQGSKVSLGADQVGQLASLVQTLSRSAPSIPTTVPAMVPAVVTESFSLEPSAIALVLQAATTWPYKDRLPCLDLLRCMAPSVSLPEYIGGQGEDILTVLLPSIIDYPKESGSELVADPKSVENNAMMVLRLITNLFVTTPGQRLAVKRIHEIVEFLSHILDITARKNRNMMVAWASAASNITSFALREQEATGQNSVDDSLVKLIKLLAVPILDLTDAEVVYRSLIALGNLASIPGQGDFAGQVRSASAGTWVNLAIGKSEEARVKSVGEKVLKTFAT